MGSRFDNLPKVLKDVFSEATQRFVETSIQLKNMEDKTPLEQNIIILEHEAAKQDVNRIFQLCLSELGEIDS